MTSWRKKIVRHKIRRAAGNEVFMPSFIYIHARRSIMHGWNHRWNQYGRASQSLAVQVRPRSTSIQCMTHPSRKIAASFSRSRGTTTSEGLLVQKHLSSSNPRIRTRRGSSSSPIRSFSGRWSPVSILMALAPTLLTEQSIRSLLPSSRRSHPGWKRQAGTLTGPRMFMFSRSATLPEWMNMSPVTPCHPHRHLRR